MPSNRTTRVANMFSQTPMLMLLFCILFMAGTNAQLQSQPPAISGNITSSTPSCIPHERDALLAFKNGVTSDPAGLLSSWRRDGGHGEHDCCRWRGVQCSNRTGHVHELRLRNTGEEEAAMDGEISLSLLALEHLEHLDLSGNDLAGPTGRLPEFLGSLKNLKYLNLSGIPFNGGAPSQLGNLSRLQYLDLSDMGGTNSTDLSWLTGLPSIQYLNLNQVNLSTVADWPYVMNMLPSLRFLVLSDCSLASANQSLPHLNLTNLKALDASGNSFDHPMATSWFWNITSLKYLYLGYTSMYGQFPDALEAMASLQVLDLSVNTNDKYRTMTMAMRNLCNLEVLNLDSALLYGDVAELFRNKLPRCSPNKLQELDLSSNQLTGMLPRWIGQITSLVILNLNSNNITGSLPTSIGQLTSLQTLDLSWNNLNGHVPYEIGKLSNLINLDLSSNKLDGVITEEHFVTSRNLQYIDLSYTALKIEISSDWQPPSKLDFINFASCQMGLFPGWLQRNVSITYLDISSVGIADRLPQWFSHAFSNTIFLNMSNNQLNGTLLTDMGSMSLQELYLNSNQLTGQVPTLLPPNLSTLDLSNNFLSGPLPTAIVGSANLNQLSLFSNQITGHIPQSFCKFQGLKELDLSNNFLEGELPSCLGALEVMEFIALSNNSLSGEFPSFLQNFSNFVFLDLSWNKFSGGLPMWIGKLTSLTFLRLSNNKFSGNIPVNITNLACLQYMDLSNNKISGPLPRYFSNLETMRKKYKTDYPETMRMQYKRDLCSGAHVYSPYPFLDDGHVHPFHLSSLSTIMKGQELNYGSIFRVWETSMMSIDLSSNNLIGEIPEQIVLLDGLVNLNLSRNHLSGIIPNKIREMQSLQSLDLSRNKLSGEIPATLSNLTFLSYLDLSYNNLTGRVPSGPQLDTLYAEYPSMYIGNSGLCGHPVQNNCSSEGHALKQGGLGRTEEGHGIQFFYLGLGCGFVVGSWIAFGVLLFKKNWRIACFRLLDKLYDKVYVLVATWARARRTQTD